MVAYNRNMHDCTPNSECGETVSPSSQASQATVPSSLQKLMNGAGNTNSSEETKIVSGGSV